MIEALELRTRLNEQEAADYLGVEKETLRRWRTDGQAPRFTKVGRKVQYRVSWLEDYIEAHVEEPIIWPHRTDKTSRARALRVA